jgi:hypothetical protein
MLQESRHVIAVVRSLAFAMSPLIDIRHDQAVRHARLKMFKHGGLTPRAPKGKTCAFRHVLYIVIELPIGWTLHDRILPKALNSLTHPKPPRTIVERWGKTRCARVARNIMKRLVMLGNAMFCAGTVCNMLRQRGRGCVAGVETRLPESARSSISR